MTRTQALTLLTAKACKHREKFEAQPLAPLRIECRDGKCGRCHSCKNATSVPVALKEGGER